MRLVLLGAPGCGKGTQADVIKSKYPVIKLSTGDLLRGEIKADSDLGKLAKSYMDKGELVPDDVMINILDKKTQEFEKDETGYILDGFPRTVKQGEALLEMLDKQGVELSSALLIDVPQDELIRRLSTRWTCRECSTTVGFPQGKPEEAVCRNCGGELYQREDDKKETIINRMKVYEANTAPLIDFFTGKNLLDKVNGLGTLEEISQRIFDLFKSKDMK